MTHEIRVLKPGEKLGDPSLMEALRFSATVGIYYPRLLEWFRDKVGPGLKDGTRKLFWRRNERQELVALAIAKKTPEEKKLCLLRVDPRHENNGFGYALTQEAMEWLDTNKPFFTISQDNVIPMRRWIEHFGFEPVYQHQGLYLPGKTELFFNEAPPHDLGRIG